jgi:DNA-binding MarR family transcriptional regulator
MKITKLQRRSWSSALTLFALEEGEWVEMVGVREHQVLSDYTAGNALKRLANNGWAEKKRHPTDGRARLYRITAKGRAAIAAYRKTDEWYTQMVEEGGQDVIEI